MGFRAGRSGRYGRGVQGSESASVHGAYNMINIYALEMVHDHMIVEVELIDVAEHVAKTPCYFVPAQPTKPTPV